VLGPTIPRSLLLVGFFGPALAPSVIIAQAEDCGEEEEDWLWGMMKFELVNVIEVARKIVMRVDTIRRLTECKADQDTCYLA